MGTDVTVVEFFAQWWLPVEDEEISKQLDAVLKRRNKNYDFLRSTR